MNNKLTSTKRTSAIFLATVLILGTIATISPSFMLGAAQAEPYYGQDNNYEKSYGKENYKSTKDSSSVDLKKIKCNNINININGQDGNNGNTTNDKSSTNGNETNNGNKKFHKDGFAFVCINNNNNVVVGVDEDDVEDACEKCFNANATVAGIITAQLREPGAITVIPGPLPGAPNGVVIGEDVTTIAGLCNFLVNSIVNSPLDLAAGDLNRVIQAILAAGPDPDPVLSAESVTELIECLLAELPALLPEG